MTIKLIVGLRNPGTNYAATRHNAGGWFVEHLAQEQHISFKTERKLQNEVAVFSACKLALPLTFMNLSGTAVRAVSQFYNISASEILIVHDELDLPVGNIKLKTGGGHGGHNGLRDLIQHLGNDFHRMRIGIGHPGHKELVHDYVLHAPSVADREQIKHAIQRGISIIPILLKEGMAAAMNVLNQKVKDHGI